MADFKVQITRDSDGEVFTFPVSGVESQEDANRLVLTAVQTGEIDVPNLTQPAPTPPAEDPRSAVGAARSAGGKAVLEILGSVEQGIQEGLFELTDLSLLVADFVADDDRATARINVARDFLSEKREAVRAFNEEGFREVFGEDSSPGQVGVLVGKSLPFLRFIPKTSTATRTIAANTAAGGVFGALEATEDAEKLEDVIGQAKVGALFGFALTTPLVVIPGVRAFAGRKLNEELRNKLGKESLLLEKQVQELTGNPNFHFDIAQLAVDNPYLTSLVRGAAARTSIQKANRNLKTLIDFIEKRAATLKDPEAIVNDLAETMVKAAKTLRKTANRNYGKQIDSLLEANGDKIIVSRERGVNYLDGVLEAQGELGDARKFATEISKLQKHADFLDVRLNPVGVGKNKDGTFGLIERALPGAKPTGSFVSKSAARRAAETQNRTRGGLNTEDIKEMMEGHRQLISGDTNIFAGTDAGSSSNIGKLLQLRLLNALRGSDDAAVAGILRARKGYAFDMARVRTLENSTIGRIFGKNADIALAEPEVALNQLLSRGRTSVEKTRKILSNLDGGEALLADMKAVLLRQIINESRVGVRSAAFMEESVEGLAKALTGRGRTSNVGRRGFGLFTPGEQQELITVGHALRRLVITSRSLGEKDAAGLARDFVINVISQTAAFMGRFVIGTVAKGSTLERMLVDPNARKALIAAAEAGPNTLKAKAAIAFIITFSARVEREERDKERREVLRGARRDN